MSSKGARTTKLWHRWQFSGLAWDASYVSFGRRIRMESRSCDMKKRRTSLAIVAAVFAALSFIAGFVPLRAYPEIATALGYILVPMFFAVCFCLVIAEIGGDGPAEKMSPRGVNL